MFGFIKRKNAGRQGTELLDHNSYDLEEAYANAFSLIEDNHWDDSEPNESEKVSD